MQSLYFNDTTSVRDDLMARNKQNVHEKTRWEWVRVRLLARNVDKAKLARNCWWWSFHAAECWSYEFVSSLIGSSASYVCRVWSLGRSMRLTTYLLTLRTDEDEEGGLKPRPNCLRGWSPPYLQSLIFFSPIFANSD